MTTPIFWIVLPGVTAILLLAIRRFRITVQIIAILLALALAYTAWALPIGDPIKLIPWPRLPSVTIEDTLLVFGRQFTLGESARPALMIIYLGIALWFGGASAASIDPLFVPLGLICAALLTASIAVEPFLYAAIFILGVALVCIPILSPPGVIAGSGVLRFLTFQTIGMPVILIGGRFLTDVEINPNDTALALRVTVMIALGLALITAIFPFHTWIPMTAEESHPYAAAFVFFLVPTTVTFLSVAYLERYARIGVTLQASQAIGILGIIMVLVGGIWAAFENHLARIMGYAAIYEIGMTLLALSISAKTTGISPVRGIYFAQLLPRAVGLAIWALALFSIREKSKDLQFQSVKGAAYTAPFAAASLVLANFTIAGLPFLAAYPISLALWTRLSQGSFFTAVLSLIGASGLVAAGLRSLSVLVTPTERAQWQVSESTSQIVLMALGLLILLIVGILPGWFTPVLTNLAIIYSSGAP